MLSLTCAGLVRSKYGMTHAGQGKPCPCTAAAHTGAANPEHWKYTARQRGPIRRSGVAHLTAAVTRDDAGDLAVLGKNHERIPGSD